MNSFQLAMRVLRVDRRTRTSAILTAVGVAVATSLVLLLASLPGATQARSQRAIWQDIYSYNSPESNPRPAPLLMAANKDFTGDQQIIRVDVAQTGTSPMLSLPPGIPKLPGPGESIVSPALGKLIQSTPQAQLGDRFGKLVDALGPDALMYPEQLVAVVGHTPESMPESALAADGFPNKQAKPDPMLELLAWVGVIVLLVPSLVLVASSARLTAARRELRMAALRLAGATPGQVTKMVAAETALSAVVGALLGILVAPALQGLSTFVPWGGGTWLASDFSLSVGSTIAVAVAIPLLVVFAGVMGIRRVLKTPLFAASAHARKPLHWWRLLAVPAAGAFFLFAVNQDGDGGMLMVMLGLFLLVGSAAIVGPWVTSAVGGTFVQIWRKPASLLAGRRLRDDPKSAYRATAGVVLAVFTGSMALTLLPSFESMAGGGRTFKDDVLYANSDAAHSQQVADQTNASLTRNGVAEKAVVVGQVYLASGEMRADGSQSLQRAFVATCEDATKLLRVNIGGSCQPGPAVYSSSSIDPSKYRVTGEWNQAGVQLGNVPVRTFPQSEKDTYNTIVIDPALVPAGVKPENVDVVVPTTPANAEVVRTALVGAAPGQEVGSRGLHMMGQQQELADLRRVTVIGLIAAGVLAGCSAAVATAGSVMDRRRTFGALIAAGTPVRVLARALRMEAALPAMVATIGAGVVGIGVGMGLYSMVEENSVVLSPWLLAPVVLGIGVALLGASVSTPALKRVQAEPLADE
ncbi:FtsX-like permease family protein [Amycolatopsis sp. lyj-112]|uniref:FtsX-like permease family protein n=1 Tax=Amycolatopsis sp. lyj-112 TaxID=2789288 RepID=UPI003978D04A